MSEPTDIVAQLRRETDSHFHYGGDARADCVRCVAAAEIERLRDDVENLIETLEDQRQVCRSESALADELATQVRHTMPCDTTHKMNPQAACICGAADALAKWREARP